MTRVDHWVRCGGGMGSSSRHRIPQNVTPLDLPVSLVHWPEERERERVLARDGQLRLLLVAPGADPLAARSRACLPGAAPGSGRIG